MAKAVLKKVTPEDRKVEVEEKIQKVKAVSVKMLRSVICDAGEFHNGAVVLMLEKNADKLIKMGWAERC